MLDDLLEGVRRRTAMYQEVMAQGDWDLFACGITEMHCAGHHFWHFQDPSHYRHDPAAPQRSKDAMRTVYGAADEAIGKLIEAAGEDCTVLVFAPQGMRALTGGMQLMEEIVVRLGMGTAGDGAQDSVIRRVQATIKRNAPQSLYPYRRRLGHSSALRGI